MNSSTIAKAFRFLASWMIVLVIWFLWFISGFRGAWTLHHRMMWKDFSSEFTHQYTFALATGPNGEALPISFDEIKKRTVPFSSLEPPTGLSGKSKILKDLTTAFNQTHEMGKPGFVEFSALDTNQQGTRFEVQIYYPHGSEWKWRYRANKDMATPLEWYEIHDTAGVVMVPMAMLFWVPGFILALWLSRAIFRFRKRFEVQI